MGKSRSRSRDFHRNNEVIDFDRAREKRRRARAEKAERVYQARKEAPSQRKAAKKKRRLLILRCGNSSCGCSNICFGG